MIAGLKNTRARYLGLTGERKNEGIYSICSCVTTSEIAAFDTVESCAEFGFFNAHYKIRNSIFSRAVQPNRPFPIY